MKILVVGGSPKGKNSITLQTMLYLQLLHPEHSFSFLHAGAEVRKLEKDFSPAAAAIADAEAVVFCYPVYTFLAPSQLHRFIRLMKENGISLSRKYVTQFTTSMHFYDITAHAYIRDNCFDLGGRYVKGLSAMMDDLTTDKGQKEARDFFDYFIWCVQNGISEPAPAPQPEPVLPAPASVPSAFSVSKPGDTVIVADLAPDDSRLSAMIDRFRAVYPRATRVVNIHDFPFRGGCISCFHCSVDGTCIYKDGFQELLRDSIQQAEAIVLAFTVSDHSMGTVFKTYDDRQFCNGHRTVTMGKSFGYLVSGALSREENLRSVIDARAEVGGNFFAGVASDEFNPDSEIDTLASRLCYAVEHSYIQPANFWGVGGMKIFRDLIWKMQGMMKADHRFYKEHGQYDFPQKERGTMLAMYLVGAMMASPKLQAKMGGKMAEGMLMPYRRVLEKAGKQVGK